MTIYELALEYGESAARLRERIRQLEQARRGIATPDCKVGCRGCGALSLTGGKCDV